MSMYLFKSRSPEWLAFRKKYITATELGTLLGVNSYQSPSQLLKEKSTKENESLNNKYIYLGLAAEPMVFQILKMHGWELDVLVPEGKSLVFTDNELGLSSTPDNFRWDGTEPAIVEVKTTSEANFLKNWTGSMPPIRYIAQVYAQMVTTGMRLGYLVCTTATPEIPVSVYRLTKPEGANGKDFEDSVGTLIGNFNIARGMKRFITPKEMTEEASKIFNNMWSFEGILKYEGEEFVASVELDSRMLE